MGSVRMSRIAWVVCRRTATILTAAAAVLCFAAIAAVSAQASSAVFGNTGTSPYGMVLDSAGNVYVANWGSSDVTKITPDGTSTVNWGPHGERVTTGGSPVAITVDSAGNLYTANQSRRSSCPGGATFCSTVSKITPEGNSTSDWAPIGYIPTDITIDGADNIYTVSYVGGVSKITSQGVATTSWATTGSQPHGVVVDSAGNVYTANGGSNDVSKITPDGSSTVTWGVRAEHMSRPAPGPTTSRSIRPATSTPRTRPRTMCRRYRRKGYRQLTGLQPAAAATRPGSRLTQPATSTPLTTPQTR